jgi:hypothetical protein
MNLREENFLQKVSPRAPLQRLFGFAGRMSGSWHPVLKRTKVFGKGVWGKNLFFRKVFPQGNLMHQDHNPLAHRRDSSAVDNLQWRIGVTVLSVMIVTGGRIASRNPAPAPRMPTLNLGVFPHHPRYPNACALRPDLLPGATARSPAPCRPGNECPVLSGRKGKGRAGQSRTAPGGSAASWGRRRRGRSRRTPRIACVGQPR